MKLREQRNVTTLLLFLTNAFFLWMFLSAEGLELAALAGQVTGAELDPVHSALEFSARWRHGMAGGWPVYMPGFFLTAAAIWLWCEKGSIMTLLLHATAVTAVSTLAAWILAPLGSAVMVNEFTQETGLNIAGPLPSPTIAGVCTGAYTLLTWETFVAAGRCALNQKSFIPYLPAVVLTLGLGFVRPMLVDDFVSLWSRRLLEGNPIAIVSLILIPVLAGALLLIHTRQKQSERVTSLSNNSGDRDRIDPAIL